jgi:hypothetical protein
VAKFDMMGRAPVSNNYFMAEFLFADARQLALNLRLFLMSQSEYH